MLQTGGQGPQCAGAEFDQGGSNGQGEQPNQGGSDHDCSHDPREGAPQYVEVASLLENWSDRPVRDVTDQQWSMRCVENVVVQPGTTQKVRMQWPVLSTTEFVGLSQRDMLFEVCADEAGMTGGRDVSNTQLVGGIGPL